MSNEALQQMVIAHDHILNALLAAARKKDAIDLTLFTELIEEMRRKQPLGENGENSLYNSVIDTAKSACLIRDQQPKVRR